MNEFPQVLTIAGTDSGGGAGVMADLKTMQARHVFGTAVVVAVTAQNTLGVQDFMALPTKLIDEQCASLAADLKILACKTGMLADAEHVHAVVANLKKYDFGPLTVDPVMIAKGGAPLLAEDAVATVRTELIPLATVVTPNLPEAEKLTGLKITDNADMMAAGHALQDLGARNVIIKGGHEANPQTANDFVLLADGSAFGLQRPASIRCGRTAPGIRYQPALRPNWLRGSQWRRPLKRRKPTWPARFRIRFRWAMVTGHLTTGPPPVTR